MVAALIKSGGLSSTIASTREVAIADAFGNGVKTSQLSGARSWFRFKKRRS